MNNKPLVPVYLNQRIVFDIVAMMQDGISTVTKVIEKDSREQQDKQQYGASFGLSNVLSNLVKIGISGGRDKTEAEAVSSQSEIEKIHTPASLLFKLRNSLKESNMLNDFDQDSSRAGDIVEFQCQVERNPIIATMDAMIKAMEIADIFEDKPKPKPKGKGKSSGYPASTKSSTKKTQEQIKRFKKELEAGGTIDVLSKINDNINVVITLETNFLKDPSVGDVVEGEYSILGKIIRKVIDGDDTINLLRKTALSLMSKDMLKDIFGHLRDE